MKRKCLYCKCELPEESLIDFCESCGEKVWGKKMLNTIVENMKCSKNNGDI